MALRKTENVVQQLLDEMKATVRCFHPTVGRTANTVGTLIQGTAVFPGGAGVWRGTDYAGALPEFFPESPLMLVGHNFDSIAGHAKSLRLRGEGGSRFWNRLLSILAIADIPPEQCFFTNVLMGLKPGAATGKMPTVAGYDNQCRTFLAKQIEIVAPRAIITLGVVAEQMSRGIRTDVSRVALMHPSAREFNQLTTRREKLSTEAAKLTFGLVDIGTRR